MEQDALTYRQKNRDKLKAYDAQYYQEHIEKRRAYSREHGEQLRAYARVRSQVLYRPARIEVLTYYGDGKCACIRCGESRLACLSIDHINGKKLSKDNREGARLTWWLKRNNYPKGYQTLCMNCQWIKRVENNETGGSVLQGGA